MVAIHLAQEIAGRASFRCRSMAKLVLRGVAPTLGERLRRAYWKRRMRGVPEALDCITAASGWAVRNGPFKGMQLQKAFAGSSLLPKLVGSYEDEVNEAIHSVVAGDFETIIDIGSAEGYYAVGLAMRCGKARIFAYDINPIARKHLEELAALNGVSDRIGFQDACTHEVLEAVITGKTFILCDIEGAERDLIDPACCPSLKRCAILAETHTHVHPDIVSVLESRFSTTHTVHRYASLAKHPDDYPDLAFLPAALRQAALDEMRVPGQVWLWLVPRDDAPTV